MSTYPLSIDENHLQSALISVGSHIKIKPQSVLWEVSPIEYLENKEVAIYVRQVSDLIYLPSRYVCHREDIEHQIEGDLIRGGVAVPVKFWMLRNTLM